MPEHAELIKAVLPDGQAIWVRVEAPGGPVDVALPGAMAIDGFVETLQGVAANVRSGLRRVRPARTSVEFGIELALGKDGLFAALAGVSGKAAVKVTLVWGADDGAPQSAEAQEDQDDAPPASGN